MGYVEDFRIYDWRILEWEPAIRCDFLNGDPVPPPPEEEYFNFRVFLNEHYRPLSKTKNRKAHVNAFTYDFFNIPYLSMKEATNLILSILNIPKENHKSMAPQILYFADTVPNFEDTDALYMILVVNVDIFYHNCDRAIETPMDDEACKLKRVKLQEEERLRDNKCPICWEDFMDDAVQMPCSHFFHGNCIINWLLRKTHCPLCRFQISFSDDS